MLDSGRGRGRPDEYLCNKYRRVCTRPSSTASKIDCFVVLPTVRIGSSVRRDSHFGRSVHFPPAPRTIQAAEWKPKDILEKEESSAHSWGNMFPESDKATMAEKGENDFKGTD